MVVEVGFTLLVLPVPIEFPQTYESAPEAVSVDVLPEQIDAGFVAMLITGAGLTLTVTLAVPVQPPLSVPVRVYVVVTVGNTLTVFDEPRELLQLYVEAPFAVSVDEFPEHTELGEADAVTLGRG